MIKILNPNIDFFNDTEFNIVNELLYNLHYKLCQIIEIYRSLEIYNLDLTTNVNVLDKKKINKFIYSLLQLGIGNN
jgi:hypothetical protein